ncbi:MAG: LPS-assembly protein LptD, partial [Pseudomonadota bacterium]
MRAAIPIMVNRVARHGGRCLLATSLFALSSHASAQDNEPKPEDFEAIEVELEAQRDVFDAPPETDTPEPVNPVTAQNVPAGDGNQGEIVEFEANELAYDSEADTVLAKGDVILRSEDRSVRANEVFWNRQTGSIVASGNVRFVDERGNQLFTEQIELNDEFEAGAMD